MVVTALVPDDRGRNGDTVYAIFGGIDRRGAWNVPRRMRIVALFGGANLDLREARFPPGVIDIDVTAVMGGINILVPPGLAVQMHGSAIMGGFADVNRAPAYPDPDAPLLRVHGLAMMGGVNVEMRLPGESERRRAAAREAAAARGAAGAAPAGSPAMSATGPAPAPHESPRCWRAAPSWCARSGWASGWWRARTSAISPPG